jgi:hypothetical protein
MNADREEQLFIRLLLDEDVHPQAAPALRRRGFDVVSSACSAWIVKSRPRPTVSTQFRRFGRRVWRLS